MLLTILEIGVAILLTPLCAFIGVRIGKWACERGDRRIYRPSATRITRRRPF